VCQVVLIIIVIIVVIGVGIFGFFWIIVWVLQIIISTVWTISVARGITIGHTLCLDSMSWKWKRMFVSASLECCLGCLHSHEVGFECMKLSGRKILSSAELELDRSNRDVMEMIGVKLKST
jgi:hypothetical protein